MQSRYDNAVTIQQSGRLEEAIQEFHHMAAETSDVNWKAALLLNEINCYDTLGRFDDVDRVLEEIVKLTPNDEIRMNVSFVAALISAKRGKHKEAAFQYANALKDYAWLLDRAEYRDFFENVYLRGAIELASSGDYIGAIPLLKEAALFPTLSTEDRQEAHSWLGTCYEELHENELAISEFQRVIAFNLGNGTEADTRYCIARLYFGRGGFAQAKQQLEILLRDYIEVAGTVPLKYIYEQLSRACHYLGEKENAKHYAKKARDLSGT